MPTKGASGAAKLYGQQGYFVRNQAAYERAKAAAAARAGEGQRNVSRDASILTPASGDPDIFRQWTGLSDDSVTPPDTDGAIGPGRYIELVNLKYAIHERESDLPLSTGALWNFAGANTDVVSDPQVIWDPGTNRFYYVVLEFSHFFGGPNPDNRLYVGFSRTATPNNGSTDWCKYYFSYGDFLPDYPKLGDSSAFFMIGSNVFNPLGSYVGSDVAWISKPPAGTGCPSPASFHAGAEINLNGGQAFTPIPANQTDTSSTGYVVATNSFSATRVDTFKVTKNASGNAVFGPAVAHTVASYSVPPNAPQPGTVYVLDTLDGRLTNGISGFDPSKGKTVIWTQHTVAGGAGSKINWYEIDPGINASLRVGSVSDGSLYAYNAAISPDRKVSGSTKRFGDAFVMGLNTSSASDLPRIQMVSKWADNAQSGFVEVKGSEASNQDFSCASPPCRWGDYSGASPDPASNSYSSHGRVWLSNQWVAAGGNVNDVDWQTYSWGSDPAPFVILTGPITLFQKATSFIVDWVIGNEATADIRYRRAPWNGSFGSFNIWRSPTETGGDVFAGSAGNTYCFSGASYDDSHTVSFGSTMERCAVVPLDDRSLAASSGWSRRTGSGFYKNTYTRTTSFGKSLTRTGIKAKRVQVLVEKCPTCGSIKIYWNGSLKHSYSLHAGSTQKLVYLSAVSFSSVHSGTLKIVVSSSGKPVIIDALGVSRV